MAYNMILLFVIEKNKIEVIEENKTDYRSVIVQRNDLNLSRKCVGKKCIINIDRPLVYKKKRRKSLLKRDSLLFVPLQMDGASRYGRRHETTASRVTGVARKVLWRRQPACRDASDVIRQT